MCRVYVVDMGLFSAMAEVAKALLFLTLLSGLFTLHTHTVTVPLSRGTEATKCTLYGAATFNTHTHSQDPDPAASIGVWFCPTGPGWTSVHIVQSTVEPLDHGCFSVGTKIFLKIPVYVWTRPKITTPLLKATTACTK